MKRNKICCVFNYNPLYRLPIYRAMDEAFDCDFFFADNGEKSIRQFDPSLLCGYKATLHAIRTRLKGYVWFSNARDVFRTRYTHYIVTGENLLIINWLLILWTKLTGKKLIMWTHGEHRTYRKWSTNFILRRFYRNADVLLMYANYNRRYMTALGCREGRMRTIHNSLDTRVQSELYGQMAPSEIYHGHFGNTRPTVVYIGRLQKRKRVEQLIEAAAMLRAQGREVNVVLVGDDVDADYLHDIVRRHGMDGAVWFYGASYDEPCNAELLFNAAVCVCPAAVGLTAIHAMSYGCPVVSNDNVETQMPEFESIIEGETGSLFREDDINDLAEKIWYWVNRNEAERRQTRDVCRSEVLRQWSVDYQINLLRDILQ